MQKNNSLTLSLFILISISLTLQTQSGLAMSINTSGTEDPSTVATSTGSPVEETMKEKNATETRSSSIKSKENTNKTESHQTEAMNKLFDVLNSTLLKVNQLSIEAENNSKFQQHKDFERVKHLVQNVQTFLTQQTNRLSQESSNELIHSLRDIQKFFNENQKKLQATIQNGGDNGSTASGTSIKGSNENATESVIIPKSDVPNNTAEREGRTGLIRNFMKISSKVGQGVEATVRGAGNVLTDSVNQIQNQISQFIKGVSGFITNMESSLPFPNLFNFALPTLPDIVKQ